MNKEKQNKYGESLQAGIKSGEEWAAERQKKNDERQKKIKADTEWIIENYGKGKTE